MTRSVGLAASRATLLEPLARGLPPDTGLQVIEMAAAKQILSAGDLPTDICLVLVPADQLQTQESCLRRLFDVGIPVVAILTNPDERDQAFRAGASDYLLEPLVASEVQARLVPYLQDAKPGQKGMPAISPDAALLEQLDQQLIQNERWIAMGRVVAAICHDITNCMQAAQGALTLAAEETSLSEDMQAYLDLAAQETRRVTAYLQRLRRVYHPETDAVETINVPELLLAIGDLASDAAVSGALKVETFVAPDVPPLRCKAGQLEFVLLGILLNLMDLVSADSPALVLIGGSRSGSAMNFEISTNSPLADWIRARQDHRMIEHALGLSSFRALVAAQNGKLEFSSSDSGLKIWISLPIPATLS